MGKPDIDMEVTPERAQRIKEELMRQIEDQYGCKFEWTVVKTKEEAPA